MEHLTYFDHLKIIAGNWGAAFLLFGLFITGTGIWLLVGWLKSESAKRSRELIIGAILLIIAGLVWSYLQTLIPTRYAANPTRKTVVTDQELVATIRPLYDEHCALCHGDRGLGDGPIADFMFPPPADFSIHGWHHREGEHYWWISRGIGGTAMPSFSATLSEDERWMLSRFVKQLGREARLNIDNE